MGWSFMTVVVLHEKCELGKAEDKKLPSDSFLVSYKVEDEIKYDITRAASQSELFDHYYDNYKNVQKINLLNNKEISAGIFELPR